MTKRVRNAKEGQMFILKRTGEQYLMLRKEIKTPSGTRYIVKKGENKESSLHHSCHVVLE